MSVYQTPVIHTNNSVNSVVNCNDYESTQQTSNLTVSYCDNRYLKLTGGTVAGSTSFTQNITVPNITLSSNTSSQTSSQLGYRLSSSGTITPMTSTTLYSNNSLSLTVGVWLITSSHGIRNSANSITITGIQYGLSTSSSSFNISNNISSLYSSETIASGNYRYANSTFILPISSTTTVYGLVQLTFSSTGTVFDNYALSACRIA
jgi:hypothetical protein